ncbi:MAG: AraC family transcriptional regulator, partial [Oscillospiraceae bacterium]
SNSKIFEIAQDAGYVDQHYFSYCFKKYYGVSPNKMRESIANEKN